VTDFAAQENCPPPAFGAHAKGFACAIPLPRQGKEKKMLDPGWFIALLPFTSGDEFSRCFLTFEAWLMQTTQP
jgi:hypothetical protein